MAGRSTGRILIIDDDNQVRRINHRVLERAGYDVRSAASLIDGIELSQEWSPDLVLLDLVMPDTGGVASLTRLRREPGLRDAAVVAYSGAIVDSDTERFLKLGFDAVLPKPVSTDDLIERIALLLQVGRQRRHKTDT
jgi:CheY-like chemotaxis protein